MLNEIERFVNWIRRRNPQAHTFRDYRCDLKQFVACVGDVPPTAVTLNHIDTFISQQVKSGYCAATINRRLAAIMSLYTFLSDEEPEIICPVLPRRHFLRQRQRLPRPVSTSDLQAFFAVIEDVRDQAMFLLMLRCGLRLCEVARLRLRDLYLAESPPRLLVSGKNSKERTAYLSEQMIAALQSYLTLREPVQSDHLFLSYQGQGLSTTAIHKRLMKYRDQAGIHLTAHQLRHTFANDMVSADVPVTSIQQLLGHAWLTTTQTYVAANNRQIQRDFYGAIAELEGWQ